MAHKATTEASETAETVLPVVSDRIVTTAGVCGGKPRIAGHRITVQNVAVWHERMGMSPDEIATTHPGVTLADVYAALSYYHSHRSEVDARIKADEEFVADLKSASGPSLLQQKLEQRNAADPSLPSR